MPDGTAIFKPYVDEGTGGDWRSIRRRPTPSATGIGTFRVLIFAYRALVKDEPTGVPFRAF